MKTCNHCGKDVDKNDIFCEYCGNKVGEAKESEEFIRMREDYPIISKRDKDVIALTEEKKKFGFFSDVLKQVKSFIPKKKEELEFITEQEPVLTEEPKNEKFFITPTEETTNNNAKDEFILDDFEGVYTSKLLISGKSLKSFLRIGSAVILTGVILFALSFLFWRLVFPIETGECPYACCVNSTFEDKLCPGYSECVDNSCVLDSCPDEYTCCSGVFFEEKRCAESTDRCTADFTCEKKDCPYECCTERDAFQVKFCENDGNCINNKCYQQPCPFECCDDEVLYNDKSCGVNKVCVTNECQSRVVHDTSKVFGFIKTIIEFIL